MSKQHPQEVALQATCIQPKAGQDRFRRCVPRCLRQDRPKGERLAASPLLGHAATLSQRGFTLLELIVVITLIVVMMGLFLDRALFYMEQAEKTAMEEVAGSIQSALTMQYGQLLTRGKPSDVTALVQDNPMNWLQKRPRNYAGEFYDPAPLAVESGNWVFDLKSRELIYVVRNANDFKPGRDGNKWIRFHIAVRQSASRLPSLQNAPQELTGVLFEPVEPYSWF
jgi:prepilin-type N-terminal cleavage/methylation domain-containing protein